MARFDLKHKAIEFRKLGLSVSEIANQLGISKSTSSLWCREITLTKSQQRRLHRKMLKAGHRGRLLGAAANRQKKEDVINNCQIWAKKVIVDISDWDFFIAGIMLYWAEGSKSYKNNLSIVNSDPNMILFIYSWFMKYFDVRAEDFILRVSINEIHQQRISEVLNFWSHLLRLPKGAFRRTTFIKTRSRKIYENHSKYYGLLTLRIKRSSIIKYKILALIDIVRNADVAQVARASHS